MSLTFKALTRHFIGVIVAPPIFTDLGLDYLRRTLFSILAILLVIGIFLPRAFFKKYVDLGAQIHPEPYLRALQADTLLMTTVPMLIVGLAAVLVCPMLFPDERDYQVLTPLPITRRQIFGAKLLALVIVVAIGVVATNAITSIWFPFTTVGSFRRSPHSLPLRIWAHAAAALSGTVWTFSAVMAIQGSSLVLLPGAWRRRVGLALQASLFLLLLLSIPFVVRLPSMTVSSETITRPPLAWLPSAWFYGVEQWLLLGPNAGGYATAAARAAVASAATVTAIALSYAALYRSAEHLSGWSNAGAQTARRPMPVIPWLERRGYVTQPTAGIVAFAIRGLTRSRLQQFVFLLIVGAGGALLIDQIMTVVEGTRPLAVRPRASIHAAIAAPLLVALTTTLALRTAFQLPIDRGAAWIFRVTEDPQTRAGALDGVVYLFSVCAIGPALAVAIALQPRMLGSASLWCAGLTVLASLVLIECVVADWRRLPYACSYLPGKRVLAYTLGVLLATYSIFVYIGANLIRWSILSPSRTMLVGGALLATFAALRRARLRTWGRQPLEFEDEDPLAVRSLGLLPDER